MGDATRGARETGYFEGGRGLAWLWFAVLSGPVTWAIDLVTSYALVKWACASRTQVGLHLISLAAIVVIVFGASVAWRCRERVPGGATLDGGSSADRSRFMAVLGLALNLLFFVVIVATAVPRFVIGPCQ